MVVIVITGGAVGVGYEACKQLSAVPEVTKIVLTSRSKQKATDAISKLVTATGKDKAFYEAVALDLGDLNSIESAVASFPVMDRLCLNAGGLGTGKTHASGNGITDSMIINTIGHAILVDKLVAANKCPAGCRIVFVGSEVSRSLMSFVPMLPNYCGNFQEKHIEDAITKDYHGYCSCCPIRRQLGSYKNAKIVGHMHFAHLAKELGPERLVFSVSPGAVGATFAETAHFPVKQLIGCCPCIFRCICVTHACGGKAATEIGTKRYIDGVLTGEPQWKPGSMPMSGYPFPCCCWLWGANGPMIDNRPLVKYLRDEELCEKAAAKVREYAAKWQEKAPAQQEMK